MFQQQNNNLLLDAAPPSTPPPPPHPPPPRGQGTKYTSTKWIHKRALSEGYNPLVTAARCEDASEECP
jgi:hypothetical protein